MAGEDKKEERNTGKEEKKPEKEDLSQEVRNMKDDYKSQKDPNELPDNVKKEMEKTREKLEKFKKTVLKKYPYTLSIGILPPQASEKFEEEEEISDKDKKEKPIHVIVIIPEDNFKDLPKVKADLISEAKDMKPKLWLHVVTPIDIFNFGLDSKYDLVSAVAMSYPLFDKGLLGALRVAEIHKTLCLRKFEKYVASYVIAGSLVRGTSTKTSDVDVFVIVDDTDVKRMPRIELKEKLRGIIYSYVAEASALAGVKNKLSPQVYLLTDFWESVKDAHPVIFTFIRDGIPLYDRGTFLPWKLLLKMGRVKPSTEAIDMFMSMGDKVTQTVKNRLLDIVMGDIYWGVITPSQALLMLYGLPPPNVYETVEQMKKIFVDKEKILEQKYVDILENIAIKYYKGYEHEKIKEVSGAEVDKLAKDFESYMKRLKELREEIEKRTQEKTVEQVYVDVFKLLESLFGKKKESELVKLFETEIVNKGRTEPRFNKVINDLVDANKKIKLKKRPNKQEIEDVRKNSMQLVNSLIEYGQRCELSDVQKMKVVLNFKDKRADLFLTNPAFLSSEGKIIKVTGKIEDATREEFERAVVEQKGKPCKLSRDLIAVLKKEFGDFDIVL